jgi:hypothetical protein
MYKKWIEWTADGKMANTISSLLCCPGYDLEFQAKFETEATENYTMRSLMIYTPHPILLG